MPKRQETTITKRTVDALSVEGRDAVFWDRDLPGFGIRVYPSGLKKYVVQSRGPGGSRRVTLGRHGETSAEQARRGAAEAIDRIKRGEDPLPPAPEPERTMADIAKLYMRDYVPAHCKASSAEVSRPWDRARSSVRLPPCLRRRSAAPPARPEEREPIIGHLLGHRRIDTISRCAHLALDTWIIGLQSRPYYSRAN